MTLFGIGVFMKSFRQAFHLCLFAMLCIATVHGCNGSAHSEMGPYSLDQIKQQLFAKKISLPLYGIQSPNQDSPLITEFYLSDRDNIYIRTIFYPDDSNAEKVIELYTRIVPPPLEIAERDGRDVRIDWANEQTGRTCRKTTNFKTCIFWSAQDSWFVILSMQSLEDTMIFANSLSNLR